MWIAVATDTRRLATAAIAGRGMYRSTGIAAVAAGEHLIARGDDLAAGCFDPVEVLSPAVLGALGG